MADTAFSHQGVIKMFWPHYSGHVGQTWTTLTACRMNRMVLVDRIAVCNNITIVANPYEFEPYEHFHTFV